MENTTATKSPTKRVVLNSHPKDTHGTPQPEEAPDHKIARPREDMQDKELVEELEELIRRQRHLREDVNHPGRGEFTRSHQDKRHDHDRREHRRDDRQWVMPSSSYEQPRHRSQRRSRSRVILQPRSPRRQRRTDSRERSSRRRVSGSRNSPMRRPRYGNRSRSRRRRSRSISWDRRRETNDQGRGQIANHQNGGASQYPEFTKKGKKVNAKMRKNMWWSNHQKKEQEKKQAALAKQGARPLGLGSASANSTTSVNACGIQSGNPPVPESSRPNQGSRSGATTEVIDVENFQFVAPSYPKAPPPELPHSIKMQHFRQEPPQLPPQQPRQSTLRTRFHEDRVVMENRTPPEQLPTGTNVHDWSNMPTKALDYNGDTDTDDKSFSSECCEERFPEQDAREDDSYLQESTEEVDYEDH